MSYLLLLEDIRDPYSIKFPDEYELLERVHAKNYDEFVSILNNRGLPKAVSFDFDLAPEHYQAGEKSSFTNLVGYNQLKYKTGADCARHLISYCQRNKLKLPKWFIHSMNPPGRELIKSLLTSFEKSQKDQNAPKN